MDWIQAILIIISVIGSSIGTLILIIGRMDKLEDKVTYKISEIDKDVTSLKMDISMIKGMLSGHKILSDL